MAAVPGVRRRAGVALPFYIDLRMVAGIALVGVSVAGGLVLWQGATDTTTVLVAVHDIPPGHVGQRSDLALSEARLTGGLATLALADDDMDAAVGRTTNTAIHAGESLVSPDLTAGPVLGADEVAITIPVEIGTIIVGDSVILAIGGVGALIVGALLVHGGHARLAEAALPFIVLATLTASAGVIRR